MMIIEALPGSSKLQLPFMKGFRFSINAIEGWYEKLGEECEGKQLHDLLH
jgi:hypothetical protein